jgi:hypothetical protein
VNFDYKKTYNNIYSVIKNDEVPHFLAHKSSLKITESLMDIHNFNKNYSWNLKFGGYDLDDKN